MSKKLSVTQSRILDIITCKDGLHYDGLPPYSANNIIDILCDAHPDAPRSKQTVHAALRQLVESEHIIYSTKVIIEGYDHGTLPCRIRFYQSESQRAHNELVNRIRTLMSKVKKVFYGTSFFGGLVAWGYADNKTSREALDHSMCELMTDLEVEDSVRYQSPIELLRRLIVEHSAINIIESSSNNPNKTGGDPSLVATCPEWFNIDYWYLYY